MAGGSNDPDDLIVRAFKAYETEGKIEAEMFRHALMNFGDKFSQAEVDDIFGEFEVDDDGFVESKAGSGSSLPAAARRRRRRRRRRRPQHRLRLRRQQRTAVPRRRRRRRRPPSKLIVLSPSIN